jgi:hypothetical protein
MPNESFDVLCYFTPREKRAYKIKIPITVNEVNPSINNKVGYFSPCSGSIGQIANEQ